MTPGRAALAYGRRGLAVFPVHEAVDGRCSCGGPDCSSPGKHPRTHRGVHAATTDAALIRKWWQTWPAANVAIAAGRSGLVILDVDVKGRADGRASLAALERDLGPLPRTTTASTPSGGLHLYFRAPDVPVSGSNGSMGGLDTPGIDVRSGGYYAVAPPSTIDGRPYVWTRGVRPVALPPAWVELLTVQPTRERAAAPPPPRDTSHSSRRDRYAAAALDGECSDVAATAPGRRNHRLNAAAFSLGQLVGSGDLDYDTVRERLLAAAAECGLGAREARRTIRSGLRAGMEQPRLRGAA